MKGIIKHTLRKVTLELVYQAVDERTTEIKTEIAGVKTELKEIRKRQDEDFKYLVQKIEEVKKKQDEDFRYLTQKVETSTAAINQRIDTIIQMLMTSKQDQR